MLRVRPVLTLLLTPFFFSLSTPAAAADPRVAVDINPDPDIVEISLVASEKWVRLKKTGPWTKVYAYNGTVPGPTIKGKVGDTLIVHFFNKLAEDTTIHWHGMETPANMDGSNISQGAVPPGGYFRYEYKLLSSAMTWYHPHINTSQQVDRGLHGAIIVRDPELEKSLGLKRIRSHVLVLDDALLDENNQMTGFDLDDPIERATQQIAGRIGNTLLVNGREERTIRVRRGRPQRLRLVNVSNSRFMRLSIPGHTLHRIGGDGGLLESPLAIDPIGQVLIEADMDGDMDGGMGGMGMLEPACMEMGDMGEMGGMAGMGEMVEISDPDLSKGILLTPGERADVIFTPKGSGAIPLQWHDMDRGRHTACYKQDGTLDFNHVHDDGHAPPQTLATFVSRGWRDREEFVPPAMLRSIPEIETAGASPIPVMMGHTSPDANGDITFFVQASMMDGMVMGRPWDDVTPENAPTVTIGENGIWQVVNMTGGDHNFHAHGFPFQLIETIYQDDMNPENNWVEPAPYREVKDTIYVPARPGGKMTSRTILKLAVAFDDTGREGQAEAYGKEPGGDSSGGWVFHCHILEHAARGMIAFLQTLNP